VSVIERTDAMPAEGLIEPFDAGWHAHEIGLGRKTVALLSADPGWALLGYDCRALLAARSAPEETQTCSIHGRYVVIGFAASCPKCRDTAREGMTDLAR